MAITNLTDLNAAYAKYLEAVNVPQRFERFGHQLVREYAIGRAGSQNARRGTAGSHLHLLNVERIEVPAEGSKSKAGSYLAINSCKNNGQHNGTVVGGVEDLNVISCAKCRKNLESALARLASMGL